MNLLRGKHIVPEDEEDFQHICNSLGEFTGAMQLFNKRSGEFCRVDLLIEKGYVVAASFENLERGKVFLGENALVETRGMGIKEPKGGRLELYEFEGQDIKRAKRANFEAKLGQKVSLKEIGLKLRPYQPLTLKESKKPAFQPSPQEKDKTKRADPMNIIKRCIEEGRGEEDLIGKRVPIQEIPRIFQRMDTLLAPSEVQGKKELLERLAKKKGRIDKEIAERISRLFKKEPSAKKAKKGGKVRTSIDQLYEAVQKKNSLRMDDALAKEFRVTKAQLESWAIILEEHDLVELHYPAIGEPEIRKK